jgi:hypothetical protein
MSSDVLIVTIIVTDNAKNMINVLKDRNWVSCCGHNLNLIIKNSLKIEKENIQTIMTNIEKTKIWLL